MSDQLLKEILVELRAIRAEIAPAPVLPSRIAPHAWTPMHAIFLADVASSPAAPEKSTPPAPEQPAPDRSPEATDAQTAPPCAS